MAHGGGVGGDGAGGFVEQGDGDGFLSFFQDRLRGDWRGGLGGHFRGCRVRGVSRWRSSTKTRPRGRPALSRDCRSRGGEGVSVEAGVEHEPPEPARGGGVGCLGEVEDARGVGSEDGGGGERGDGPGMDLVGRGAGVHGVVDGGGREQRPTQRDADAFEGFDARVMRGALEVAGAEDEEAVRAGRGAEGLGDEGPGWFRRPGGRGRRGRGGWSWGVAQFFSEASVFFRHCRKSKSDEPRP